MPTNCFYPKWSLFILHLLLQYRLLHLDCLKVRNAEAPGEQSQSLISIDRLLSPLDPLLTFVLLFLPLLIGFNFRMKTIAESQILMTKKDQHELNQPTFSYFCSLGTDEQMAIAKNIQPSENQNEIEAE